MTVTVIGALGIPTPSEPKLIAAGLKVTGGGAAPTVITTLGAVTVPPLPLTCSKNVYVMGDPVECFGSATFLANDCDLQPAAAGRPLIPGDTDMVQVVAYFRFALKLTLPPL